MLPSLSNDIPWEMIVEAFTEFFRYLKVLLFWSEESAGLIISSGIIKSMIHNEEMFLITWLEWLSDINSVFVKTIKN
jgi:hypothetical protein